MYLSLCLIAKDENSYLEEWLDYHILLGVEHFWIYDNESTVPLADSIQKYVQKGWVTVNEIPGKAMQLYAYDHCIQKYGGLSQWIGFIDADEFIVPKTGENLPGLLKHYEKFAGLAISSLFFGAGGNRTRPKGGQVAGYQIRLPEGHLKNRLVKSIVQPAKVLLPTSPHTFIFLENNYCVNELQHRVDTQFFPCSVSKIHLNHYFTRSAEEWKEKVTRWRGDDTVVPYTDNRWEEANTHSKVMDISAAQFVAKYLSLPPAMARNLTALTDPYSTQFLKALSAAAGRLQPPPCSAKPDFAIEHRDQMKDLIQKINNGRDFLGKGQFQEARKVYLGLTQQFPLPITYYIDFAIVCNMMGDFPAGWEALAQAWKIAPRNWVVLFSMIDNFYNKGDFEQAEKCSLLLNEFGNPEPISVAGLALAQWKQGKHDQARATASLLLPQLTPDWAKAHLWYKEVIEFMGPLVMKSPDQK